MMKNLKTLMLVSLLIASGMINAQQPPVSGAVTPSVVLPVEQYETLKANAATNNNPVLTGVIEGIKQLVGATIIVGGGTYIAKKIASYITGESDEEAIKNSLSNLAAEQAILAAQSASLLGDLEFYTRLFNGGNNIGTSKEATEALKKEVQVQIAKLSKAYFDNNAEKEALALKIKNFRSKLESINKNTNKCAPEINTPYLPRPVQTRQVTPALAAQLRASAAGA